ncbi:hypothetical protein [Prevotella sp. 10(H)]|uniref:hypothetical protein n=1 Tax=Prevotella sp. 10(H) TaxID=1158294 RepID=UPI0004A6E0FE|nr:hypothetical protein [Prevotella sp. 10(H)]
MREIINNTFGTLSSAPDNTIINKVYDYLSLILIGFKGKNDENENAITNRLCKTLNSKKPSEYPFYFHHQNIEDDKENTSTDFAVFGTHAYAQENNIDDDSPSLIKFEAKRLNSKLPKNREKEYVCGEYQNNKCVKNSGGIERFKNGRHGKDVVYAGIIGYIQTDSPKYWIQKVNNWIQEQIKNANDDKLTWLENDLLVINNENDTLSSYSSISYRVYDDNIQLRHLWIDFSEQQN